MIRVLLLIGALMAFASTIHAEIVIKEITYKAGDTEMAGCLAYDDAQTGKRPGIVVVQEWWGNNDYPRFRAKELAKLGYVAFAVDMYGKGKTTDDPKQAGEWATAVKSDPALEKQRFEAGLAILKQQPNVDPDKLGAIGYCFGGSVVLDAARTMQPLKAVVSFHGDLKTNTSAQTISTKILVCTGEADVFVPKTDIANFETEMKKAGADYKIITYPGAHHAFTNPKADAHHIDNIKYDPAADKKSWEDMKAFFAAVFGG